MMLKQTAMGAVLAAIVVTAAATRADDAAIAKDLKTLEGEWTVKSGGAERFSTSSKVTSLKSRLPVARTR